MYLDFGFVDQNLFGLQVRPKSLCTVEVYALVRVHVAHFGQDTDIRLHRRTCRRRRRCSCSCSCSRRAGRARRAACRHLTRKATKHISEKTFEARSSLTRLDTPLQSRRSRPRALKTVNERGSQRCCELLQFKHETALETLALCGPESSLISPLSLRLRVQMFVSSRAKQVKKAVAATKQDEKKQVRRLIFCCKPARSDRFLFASS